MTARGLIVTADDFGMSVEVNEAVEEGHRRGVLTCASLVVTGDAFADAVRRAQRMPKLGVGLHLALVAAKPALPPSTLRYLLDRDESALSHEPWRVGATISVSARARIQARAETEAQLRLFRSTGLPLDHVDGHWHFHQHPAVVRILAELAGAFGIRAVRVPYEPAFASWRAAGRIGLRRRLRVAASHLPLATNMWRVLERAGIRTNDWFFGMTDGGAIGRDRLLGFIAHQPPGVTEIGLHPASRRWSGPHAPPADWRVEDELAAITDPAVIAACRRSDRQLLRFADLHQPN